MSKFGRISIGVLFVLCLSQAIFAATFTVTKVADTNDGTCDADCSLREAIAAANASAANDTIAFSSLFGTSQTITLSGTDLIITNAGTLTINGPGADKLTVSGNSVSRVITNDTSAVTTINNLLVTGGTGVSTITTGRGGGIYNSGGTLTLNNVIVTANSAANGGGLNNASAGTPAVPGTLTFNNCIVSSNTATGSGGGMQNFSTSTVTINNSLFLGNISNGTTGGGGGQFNGGVQITNSTFANNSAPAGSGGGIQSNGTLGTILTNVTVSGNSSLNNGGGIHRGTTNVNFFIRNSIVAGNNGTATSPDFTNSAGGATSLGNNIIGNVGTSTGWIASDLQNTNPMLNALGENGGFSLTFLPMAGSPAINAGQNCVLDLSCAANNPPIAVTTDQRGVARPANGTVDIGAVEVAAAAANASVSGRVLSASGNAIANVTVTISNMSGVVQSTKTNSFGNYSFSGIPAGQMYTLNVLAKQYSFTPQNINVTGDATGVNITATSDPLAESERK